MTRQIEMISLEVLVPAQHLYRRFISLWSFKGVENQLKAVETDQNYKGFGGLRLFKCLLL